MGENDGEAGARALMDVIRDNPDKLCIKFVSPVSVGYARYEESTDEWGTTYREWLVATEKGFGDEREWVESTADKEHAKQAIRHSDAQVVHMDDHPLEN